MAPETIFYPILIPLVTALAVLVLPKRIAWGKEAIALAGTALNLALAILLFKAKIIYSIPWSGFGIDFSLKLYQFSGFILLAAAGFAFFITMYSTAFLHTKDYAKQFYVYLALSLLMVNGAVLSNNLVLMLFFWEGLLLTLFAMIAIGGKNAFKTGTKAFLIVGVSDLCMMIGIALTGYIAGTTTISMIHISSAGLGGLAFILLMIGAISKAGSMPFHSWIPDAALDAPLPFMAILPAALEKLLGIYFLARISLDMFKLEPHSWISIMLMTIGAITILLAVMMALIQKDYKRLLSYHAISQVGYMILGIGTLVPVGIVGGLFHMINHAMYKSCLFLTGGSVERQAGTTDLQRLGGLGRKMPVTFICFLIAAAAISGVPPFNGFFSKELVYDGALERGLIFYIAAILGSFLTAASFLKLGHAAFLGKGEEGKEHMVDNREVKEAPLAMLIPMIVIAFMCVLFGLWNALPLKNLIQPILGERLAGHDFAGMPSSAMLVIITIVVLALAFLNHLYGFKKTHKAIKATDHIRYAPGLKWAYDKAENRFFDPYNVGLNLVNFASAVLFRIDRAIDWVYNVLVVTVTDSSASALKRLHTGNYKAYIIWSLGAAILIVMFLLRAV
ncbi:MAG: proton-conducting transporter membrane subunit [Candidatus Omnitrophica bacterium]|nr:proton-conducting transporter membrane subunit [Candidatus Omnitrophota bacterium]